MKKLFLILMMTFALISNSYSAGSSGGGDGTSDGGNKKVKVSKYKYGVKNINKAKNTKRKIN